ncbi:uncharacterized protein LOC112270718 [Brachypodium distachyon]|uniref:uncharacterized protein LOC112270718 n=1 Tax=Brachypodium distachyon TaxID=15368 RepID=UPI000D0D58E1|nr:uncharacterized protein LOC112270718 [Brachypodium distachyon]|eukprot:XP_024314544.1 uncharacterized protein LOC112270718 [Brachypodium distachyon]
MAAPRPDPRQTPAAHGVLRSLPLLVFEHQPNHTTTETAAAADDCGYEMLMFSVSEERSIIRTETTQSPLPEIMATKDRMCFSTPQGWVFVYHNAPVSIILSLSLAMRMSPPWETWLWHPLTGEMLPLPPIREDHFIPTNARCLLTHASLAAHPADDCAVVLLDNDDLDMWFCRIHDGAWGHHAYDIGDFPAHPAAAAATGDATNSNKMPIPMVATSYNYCLRDPRSLGTERGDPKKCGNSDRRRSKSESLSSNKGLNVRCWSWAITGVDTEIGGLPEGMYSAVLWLLEFLGEIFQVSVCFRVFDPDDVGAVLVHKMDFGLRRLRGVHDIGDNVFLLPDKGGNGALCPASTCGLAGNRVYFMKNFKEDDADICVYEIGEQTMEVVQAHDLDLLLVRTCPYWIVPSS